MTRRPPCPLEHDEQARLVTWADTVGIARWPEICTMQTVKVTATLEVRCLVFPLLAIPNGGDRHPAVAAKLKAEGVRSGIPDLFLAVPLRPGAAGLWIEMKRQWGSTTSKEQTAWILHLESMGYRAVVCRGADEAIEAIEEYLEGEDR